MPRIADALSPRQYEGTPVSEMATAAPPTYAQQAARIPGRIMDALRALGAGQTYGTAEPTNSISDLARVRLGRGSVFGVPEDVQQRNVARATDIAMMAAPIVYHGSPHRFAATAKNPLGEFDPTKIGTGEGQQVYGYGHYLSETPDVAQGYRIGLSNSKPNLAQELENVLSPTFKGKAPDWADAISTGKTFSDLVASVKLPWQKASLQNQKPQLEKLIKEAQTGGSLYKVDLPDEVVPRMLDWDKPLSQQNWYRPVADVVKEYKGAGKDVDAYARLISKANARGGEVTGGQFYDGMLSQFGGSQTKVSEFMREAGIPGIKYLDEASRKKGTGTRNFVVFPGNEGLLNILGRE